MTAKKHVSPTKEVFQGWTTALNRLNDDLSGLEQLERCFQAIGGRFKKAGASRCWKVIGLARAHLLAIGVRRIYRKGNRPENVALLRLQGAMYAKAEIVLQVGSAAEIEAWVGPDNANEAGVRRRIHEDIEEAKKAFESVGEYADTIAHLERLDDSSAETKIASGALRAGLERLRTFVETYSRVLTGFGTPDLNKWEFVENLENELADRI